MADHKDEQVMDAVVAVVTGLTSTGVNVKRGRVYPHDDSALPALSVYMGPSEPVGDPNAQYQDRMLDVRVEAFAKESTDTLDQTLNQIKKEVYIAMQATPTLGLGFVFDTTWSGDTEPDLQDGSNKPTGSVVMNYRVHYRHSYTDPSA